MKKIYATVVLALFFSSPLFWRGVGGEAFAQCNPAIPGNANVVDSTQTVNGGFTPQWVCKYDTLFSGGGIFFVYLETGAVMSTGGGIDSIYVKNGATLIMNGGIHVILHEPLAVLNVTGGIPTYYPCSAITYDYTNAPLDGCLITSVSEENINSTDFSAYPNPFTDELTVSSNQPGEIKIIDIYGRLVYERKPATVNCKLQTANWQKGIYFVEVITDAGRVVKKVVKQ